MTGRLNGFELLDVDADGERNIVALVDRLTDFPTPTDSEVVGWFLEAYRVSGTRLADNRPNWPISVDLPSGMHSGWDGIYGPQWNQQFAIGDVDSDGRQEVLQLLRIAPHSHEVRQGNQPGIRIEVVHLP